MFQLNLVLIAVNDQCEFITGLKDVAVLSSVTFAVDDGIVEIPPAVYRLIERRRREMLRRRMHAEKEILRTFGLDQKPNGMLTECILLDTDDLR